MDDYRQRIDRAVAVIDEDLAGEIRLERLASAAGFSPYHFHRIFATQMGETPDNYVARLRMERAANYLIKYRERSITEIALLCGYTSPAGFARAFKKRFGVSAREFRRVGAQAFADRFGRPVADRTAGLVFSAQAVRIQELPWRGVAYIPSRSGYDLTGICAAWDRLYRWMAARGQLDAAAQMIGVSFDDPFITAKTRCRYYACISVAARPALTQPVGYLELPGGRYACCRVDCTAEQIEAVYHTLYGAWLPVSGLLPGDSPTYEIYRATPDMHPCGLFTIEVCLPVEG